MTGRFQGKVVIVTGSSNGIGRECLFVTEGAKVTITGRNESALQTSADLLRTSASENEIHSVIGNITEQSVQKKLVEETVAKFGKLDILVNNAGGLCQDNTQTIGYDQPTEVFDYVMDLNLKAILTLTKLAMPHLVSSKGEVVMVSSICSLPVSYPAYPYYGISKAALDQMTRSMAVEFIGKGVRVNSVNPGWIQTDIMRKQGVSAESEKEIMATLGCDPTLIPIGRPGRSKDVADLVAFLCDRSKSEFIIGQCLVVDGGTSLLSSLLNATWKPE